MKIASFLGLGAIAFCVVVGCGDDGSTTAGDGGGGTGGETTASTGGNPVSSGSMNSTATGTGNGSSTSTGMTMCTVEPDDSECVDCAKTSCCDENNACEGDAECSACYACVETTGDAAQCVQDGMCDLNDPETFQMYECTAEPCQDTCYGGGYDCTPDPMGDVCEECTKMNCCMQAQQCQLSAACAQCIACVSAAAEPTECLGSGDCSLGDPATQAIFDCVTANCNNECLGG